MEEAFKIFDLDKTGYILASELKIMMKNLGENMTDAQISNIIRNVDKNNIGKVSYKDFRNYFFDQK